MIKIKKIKNNLNKKKQRLSYPIIEIDSNKIKDNISNQYFNNGFSSNEISTTKYTRYNFIIKNLLEQFKKLTNIYFIVIAIITLIPEVSPLGPETTLLPLGFVLGVTMIKDGFEDYRRYQADTASNSRSYEVYNREKKEFESIKSKSIRVGDIIKLNNDQSIPADILVLKTPIEDGVCYVETSQLDGETNLKIFKAIKATNNLNEFDEILDYDNNNFNLKVECELPNNNLYKFKGKFSLENVQSGISCQESISEKQLLLRGSKLRNLPNSLYGLVVYCGKDTKLSLNQKSPPSKYSSIEKKISKSVLGIFAFKIVLVIISTIIGSKVANDTTNKSWYLWMGDEDPDSLGIVIVKTFVAYFANLSFLVPMSLMVTLEVVKVSQGKFMEWDLLMSYKEKRYRNQNKIKNQQYSTIELEENNEYQNSSNKYMSVKNSNLNDELALVKYIFSDKTGTLTENKMVFSKCSINGKVYNNAMRSQLSNELFNNEDNNDSFKNSPTSISSNKEPTDHQKYISEFLLNMCICNSAICEIDKDSNEVYQSQSPDEISLLECAKINRYQFKSRSTSEIKIKILNTEKVFQLLAVMDFTSERRRMSVCVRDPETMKIFIYTKGADSIMIEKLSNMEKQSDLLIKTKEHIQQFSTEGLRTLILAMKEIPQNYFDQWFIEYNQALQLIEDRDERLNELYEQLEIDLCLIGCTAIEDKLQNGVPESIEYLLKANIKIWVITGDKQETAINIGYSCKLLNPKNHLIIINIKSQEECKQLLLSINEKYLNQSEMDKKDISIVVDGESLIYILKDFQEEFLKISSKCHSLICCRTTPIQKALVVRMVKKNTKEICLSIGDGANDVSMIQEAHIGVGIMGHEGTQAARASDYSILRFRHLVRLISVHGRYSIIRNSACIKYSFYKNVTFFFISFLFSIHSGWSSQTFYEDALITTFNTVITSAPPYFMALFEKDVNERVIEKNPQLFKEVQSGKQFKYLTIVKSIIGGLYHSVAMYFGLYLLVNNDDIVNQYGKMGGLTMMASFCSAYAVITILLKAALDIKYWNFIVHIGIWGSLFIYIMVAIITSAMLDAIPSSYYVYYFDLSLLKFYLMIIIMIFICLVPNFSYKYIKRQLYPKESTILQENYILNRNKIKKIKL
ncbi:hypothetical protein DICPUDRAFT_32597 [Dictyostelium purpureum]|uniref:Phospholipid-transporting ATPase n=1 Tax=Dictyostelium purpureum TaxID=5786 RepID=F0ZJC8_DICPU|nr:uncharacterized protein DICPUDRAFT_32597 [Dictyostelium purpureum]EGC35956.1 hypothetical protein DICPUDRAFT_32597 [Dictyostelium purpureum]|eukprot:XP_003287529.1 hypothetical protein DICPUDRAFT_32597 [Dictyostelium purpureum]